MDKALVNLSITDRNGVQVIAEKQVISDSQVYPKKPENNFRIVTLRFALPPFEAEMLDMAFHTGEIELSIDKAKPLAA